MTHALRDGIQRRWPDIQAWVMGDPGAPELGTPDPDILMWCEANNCLLVTNNRASMPLHLADHLAAGRHVPGILILDAEMSIGATIEELALISGTSFAGEYADQIRYLPVSE